MHRSLFIDQEVVCQVVKCFILVKCGEHLVAFDQHAVDERIRLEQLLERLKHGDNAVFRKAPIKPFVLNSCLLPELLLLLLHDRECRDFLARYHFEYQVLSRAAEPTVILRSAPFVLDAIVQVRELLPALLKEYVQSRTDSTAPHILPSSIRDIINSKACRSALMFHTEVNRDRCKVLLEQLAQTKFPFQCAHGRPSVVPLVSLQYRAGGQQEGMHIVVGAEQGEDKTPLRFQRQRERTLHLNRLMMHMDHGARTTG